MIKIVHKKLSCHTAHPIFPRFSRQKSMLQGYITSVSFLQQLEICRLCADWHNLCTRHWAVSCHAIEIQRKETLWKFFEFLFTKLALEILSRCDLLKVVEIYAAGKHFRKWRILQWAHDEKSEVHHLKAIFYHRNVCKSCYCSNPLIFCAEKRRRKTNEIHSFISLANESVC